MKKTLLLALAIVMCASLAFAQGGHVAIYGDNPGFSDCNFIEYVTDPVLPWDIYLVYSVAPTTVRSAQFKVVNTGWGAFAGAENYAPNATVGSTYLGIVVSNPNCQSTPWLLGNLQFFPGAATPTCGATLEIVGDPSAASGDVEGTFCDYSIEVATGGVMTINGDETCPCIVSTEETNWSKIKALYR